MEIVTGSVVEFFSGGWTCNWKWDMSWSRILKQDAFPRSRLRGSVSRNSRQLSDETTSTGHIA